MFNGTTAPVAPHSPPSDYVTLTEVAGWISDADARTTSPDLTRMAGAARAAALTAQERFTFPRVVIEEAELPAGSFAVYREGEGAKPHRIAYDPAQTSRGRIEIFINIYIAGSGEYVEYSPTAYRVLSGFEAIRRADPDPKIVEFWDEVEQQVIAADDPKATFAALTELVHAETAGQPVTA